MARGHDSYCVWYMLDDRKTAILSAVVQEYISTAQPVGSSLIAEVPSIKVSSATVRNEMAVLEQEGYLVQPHTSAGRIPTDKGYRYFVDHLASPGRLDQATTKQVGEFFSAAHGRLEELLHQTSNLLASMTHNAALVVGPRAEAIAVRRVQLVSLSPTLATVVVVLANGTVENTTIELLEGDDDVRLSAAERAPVGGPRRRRARIGHGRHSHRRSVDRSHLCLGARVAASRGHRRPRVHRAACRRWPVRSMPSTWSGRCWRPSSSSSWWSRLISDIVTRGMSVAIGVEHGVEPLSACSVVVAPVVVDGEHLGSIGVLGPDADELSVGPRHRRRRQRPARPSDRRGLTALDARLRARRWLR